MQGAGSFTVTPVAKQIQPAAKMNINVFIKRKMEFISPSEMQCPKSESFTGFQ